MTQVSSANIKKIYIDRSLFDGPVSRSILASRNSDTEIEFVEDPFSVQEQYRRESGALIRKDILLVSRYHGDFLSLCPGTDGMICCNYFVINTGPGCIYDCHYCFLQSFMNSPLMSVYGNLDDMFSELDRKLRGKKGSFRVGTGEYSDSLAIEDLTGISSILVRRFADMKNVTLELKTKSAAVDPILNLNHGGHTVVAWSLNPQSLIDEIEEGTSSLEERLNAARRCVDAGYRVAFHFDPMVHIVDWERAYNEVIDLLFDTIPANRIAWISIGTFRYSPGLREIVQVRFPDDRLTAQEMIQGGDGKYRYFKTIRKQMYESVLRRIRSRSSDVFTYFCMETQSMWSRIYGSVPDSPSTLEKGFRCQICEVDQ